MDVYSAVVKAVWTVVGRDNEMAVVSVGEMVV